MSTTNMEFYPSLTGSDASPVTSDMLERWRSYISAYPLPPHMTPTGGNTLSAVTDEALLRAPPSLIAHALRTASQEGYQVVSPRQTPFSALMVRREGNTRLLGDHEVGSIADPEAEWPTIDSANVDFLLPDQPLAPVCGEIVMRSRTKVRSLTKGLDALTDPVLACLVKGRAVIDILKRDDVAGGAEEMTTLLSQAWGVDEADIMDLDGYTLGVEGELQRHAMKVDDVYPVLYAPTHIRSVISMGVADLDKSVLLPGMAMDWRRMRIFCESVFYLTCEVEGLPIKLMGGKGVPGARIGSRDNMMIFYPAPATAWSSAPGTFSLAPVPVLGAKGHCAIPSEVRNALQGYVKKVRPVSALMAAGKKVDAWVTSAVDVPQTSGETLAASYSMVTRSMTTGYFRGRGASPAVRNAMYNIISSAPIALQTRITRFLTITPEECEIHLGSNKVPDSVIQDLARRFTDLGGYMRERIASEAERRGHHVREWWADLAAQIPLEYAELGDTPSGWANAAMWLAFREPNDRWRKLKAAAQFRALATAARDSVGAVPLPAQKGSAERLLAAAQHASREIAKSFAGFYMGVSDVGYAVAQAADERGRTRTGFALREGAHLWALRARSLRALNVSTIVKSMPLKSKNHVRVVAHPVDLVLKPAPYMSYKAWLNHIELSKDVPASTKKMVMEADKAPGVEEGLGKKSSAFSRMNRPIIICTKSTVTRYLAEPRRLAEDLEVAWKELEADIREVVSKLASEVEPVPTPREVVMVEGEDLSQEMDLAGLKRRKLDSGETGLKPFWEVYSQDGEDVALGIEDELDELPDEVSDLFYQGEFESVAHIFREIEKFKEQIASASTSEVETVR